VAVEGKTIDALSQFELSPVLGILGDAVSFSQSNLFMVIAVALTWYLMKATADRGALVPGRLQALGEGAYEFIQGMVRDQVDIMPIRARLLAPGAKIGDILAEFA